MKRSLFLSAFALAFSLAGVLSFAQFQDAAPNRPNPRGQRDGTERRPRETPDTIWEGKASLGDLGLTDSQRTDVGKIMEASRRDRLRKSTELKIARMDLRSLLQGEKVDDQAVAAKMAEIQAAQGALLELRVDSALALKRILTPEQQKKMREMRVHRRANRAHGRRGRRMASPPRPGGDDLDRDPDRDTGK